MQAMNSPHPLIVVAMLMTPLCGGIAHARGADDLDVTIRMIDRRDPNVDRFMNRIQLPSGLPNAADRTDRRSDAPGDDSRKDDSGDGSAAPDRSDARGRSDRSDDGARPSQADVSRPSRDASDDSRDSHRDSTDRSRHRD
jgi:hypothetical protein